MTAAKFWVALVGAIASGVLTVFTTDTTAGKVASVVVAICTAIGVYFVPNAKAKPPAGVTGTYVGGK